jgi:hypothetical protein
VDTPTLDDWIEQNYFETAAGLLDHIKQFVEDDNDAESLHRCIMISIRQHEGIKFERHPKNSKTKLTEILKQLEWVELTLKEKLQFGLPEEVAIKRREQRTKGVLLNVIPEIQELLK